MKGALSGFLIFVLFVFATAPARAISEPDYEFFLNDPTFARLDGLLNRHWRQLKEEASRDQYDAILDNQRRWVKNGRDFDADYLLSLDPSLSRINRFKIVLLTRDYLLFSLIKMLRKNPDYPWYELSDYLSEYDPRPVLRAMLEKARGQTARPAPPWREPETRKPPREDLATAEARRDQEVERIMDDIRDSLRSSRE